MEHKPNFIDTIGLRQFFPRKNETRDDSKGTKSGIKEKVIVPPPPGNSSIRDEDESFDYLLASGQKIVKPGFALEQIPIIRHLSKYNSDLGQAVFDLVMLSNTGIDIKFDNGVEEKQSLEMRRYIFNSAKSWHAGAAGLTGIINKMFYQLWIAGAISNEWVPAKDQSMIVGIKFLNPEYVVWTKNNKRWTPNQKLKSSLVTNSLHKLNPFTYKYYALTGDEDSPYGIPPMLNAVSAIKNQGVMLDNISFVLDLMGLLGYVDARMEKPERLDNESEADYKIRLTNLLVELKKRVKQGIRDGVNVGYKDDHEFEFNSTTRDTGNIESIWELNEQQISSGLKYDSAFLGRAYNTSETSITILFTKMLSMLNNVQNLVSENLAYGFTLTLLMAGYKFESLKVEFNKSTITDTLKYQQAEEYKIRNQRQLRMDGIIGQDTYANNMGYDKPFSDEPIVPFGGNTAFDGELKRRDAKQDRQEADKKSRDKSNPQGTIRKQSK